MIGVTARTVYGATEKRLIQTVAIEQNCPKDSVKIVLIRLKLLDTLLML